MATGDDEVEGVGWSASVTISYTNNFSGRATCSEGERSDDVGSEVQYG